MKQFLLILAAAIVACANPAAPGDCRVVDHLHASLYDPILEERPDGTLVILGYGRVENTLVATDGSRCPIGPGIQFTLGDPWCCDGGWADSGPDEVGGSSDSM